MRPSTYMLGFPVSCLRRVDFAVGKPVYESLCLSRASLLSSLRDCTAFIALPSAYALG